MKKTIVDLRTTRNLVGITTQVQVANKGKSVLSAKLGYNKKP